MKALSVQRWEILQCSAIQGVASGWVYGVVASVVRFPQYMYTAVLS